MRSWGPFSIMPQPGGWVVVHGDEVVFGRDQRWTEEDAALVAFDANCTAAQGRRPTTGTGGEV